MSSRLEHSGCWTLDQRVARSLLELMASMEHQIQATPKRHSEEMTAGRNIHRKNLALLTNQIMPATFGPVEVAEGRPIEAAYISLGGETYLGPTDSARYHRDRAHGTTKSSWTTY